MATSISVSVKPVPELTDGNKVKLSHSPIIYNIKVESVKNSNIEHIRQSLVVTMKHESELLSEVEFTVDNREFSIDVSSAVRGYFISKKYNDSTIDSLKADVTDETFTMTITYKAKQQSTDNGKSAISLKSQKIGDYTIIAREGGLTEYAVYEHGATDRSSFDSLGYSLKPSTSEVVNYEEEPYPKTSRPYFAETEKNYRRKRLWFINSLGMLESASAVMREEKDLKYSTEKFKLYKDASFSYEPHVSASKSSTTSWKMSSGYTTKDWCDWWANEFVYGKRFWIESGSYIDNDTKKTVINLLPVTVNVDTVTSYDKAKCQLGCVNFTVTEAI